MERIYLDNNATTIVDPIVREAMSPFFSQMYGNPNSLHDFGTEVHPYMRLAIDRLYAGINADERDDIILNGCATEGNNTVIKGVCYDLIRTGEEKRDRHHPGRAPLRANACAFSREPGREGRTSFRPTRTASSTRTSFAKHIHPDRTALVSIMWANNETGLVFPIRDLARLCREQRRPLPHRRGAGHRQAARSTWPASRSIS